PPCPPPRAAFRRACRTSRRRNRWIRRSGNGSLRAHLVPPTGLGPVQRLIGASEQLLGRVDVLRWKSGDADAHRQMHFAPPANLERLRRDALTEPFRECDASLVRRFGQNDDELLAAVASDDVYLAHVGFEQRGELAQ